MLQTYRAILRKDRVQWQGEAPSGDAPVNVIVTLMDEPAPAAPAASGPAEPDGRAMAAALGEISARGGLADAGDPGQWQRDTRADRPLPGRGE